MKKSQSSNSGGRLKAILAATPLLGEVARSVARNPIVGGLRRHLGFQGSSSYWEKRYRQGGTSGSGSFGRLAGFKAETLNSFVKENDIKSVVEFGCGDGAQLTLARYPRYVGIDVADCSIATCRRLFAGDDTKRFYLAGQLPVDLGRFDLVLSLDVIYHLVEDDIYDGYMRSLFAHAGRLVALYSSNRAEPGDAPHIRHRQFTQWIKVNEPSWRERGYVANRFPYDPARQADTSFADFHFFEEWQART